MKNSIASPLIKLSSGQAGIEALKPVVGFLAASVTATLDADSNKDGKISFLEAARVAPSMFIRLLSVLQNFKNVGKELTDLDLDEIKELVNTLAAELKVPKEDAQVLIQGWLVWIQDGLMLTQQTATLRKKKVA